MSKKELKKKIREIVKQHTPKYEYYTPDTPMQKMMREERLRLNCYDKGNCNSRQEE